MMKRCLSLFLLLCCFSLFLAACGAGDGEGEGGIVGAWRSLDEGDSYPRLLYCFTENGHMLSVSEQAGAITSILACHYAYSDGTLHVMQYGMDTGEILVSFEGDDRMALSAVGDDSGKTITFLREKTTPSALIGANYIYTDPADENGSGVQYAFGDAMTVTVATYENNILSGYDVKHYVLKDDTITIFTLDDRGIQRGINHFRIAYPHADYITLEPLDSPPDENGIPPVYALKRYIAES